MTMKASELPLAADGSLYHIHLTGDTLADKVLLVGDPGRVDMFKDVFESVEFESHNRELHALTGHYHGVRMTALSTGMGCDNIDIVMTELDALANIDFKTRLPKPEHKTLNILRIGTCGASQPYIPLGSYILSHISIGFDGVLNWYKDGEKIFLKDFEEAFVKHMDWPERFAKPYFVRANQELIDEFSPYTIRGMTVSAPGFYGPQGRSVRLELTIPDLIEKLESFEYEGYRVTNIEMESSCLAGLAALLGHKAATVCLAIANRHIKESNPNYKPLMDRLLLLSLDAMTS